MGLHRHMVEETVSVERWGTDIWWGETVSVERWGTDIWWGRQ